ncbi:MAG: hypothetical protein ACI9MR_002759, partial [Myxococcota bacterium]
MTPSDGPDTWTPAIPGSRVAAPGTEYYLLAEGASAGANTSIWPSTWPGPPAAFSVVLPESPDVSRRK